MLPAEASFLAIVRDTVARDIAPQTSGETRKLLDSGMRLALDELVYRETIGPERQRAVLDGLFALARQHNDLVAACPQSGAKPVAVPLDEKNPTATFTELTAKIDALRGSLVAQAVEIAAARADNSTAAAWREKAREFLLALTRNELDEMSRDQSSTGVATGRASRPDVSDGRLQTVMRERLGVPDLAVTDYHRLSGGYSRDTFLVSTVAQGATKRYVIRAAAMGGGYLDGIYRSIEDEFPVLQFAWQQGVPLPRPYFLETNPDVIGSSFILMEHCAGAAVGNVVQAKDRVDVGLFRTLAQTLAKIHQLPWADNLAVFPALNGRKQLTVAEGTKLFLEKKLKWWNSATLRPSASITLAYDWLSRNIPANDNPAQAIHGDIGFHNMMVDDDKILAVLDWECAAVGSPAWDLVAAGLMLDERVTWEAFAGWYVEAGGKLPNPDELVYYRLMRALSGNLTCAISLEKWFEKAGDAGFLEFGLALRPIFQQLFLNDAAELWLTTP